MENSLSMKEIQNVSLEILKKVADICDSQGVEVLIAGAFGCGVFAQRPERVASLFIELFSDTVVKQVVFAVPPDRNYTAFERVLNTGI